MKVIIIINVLEIFEFRCEYKVIFWKKIYKMDIYIFDMLRK